MQPRQHNTASASTHSSWHDEHQYYCLQSLSGYSNSVLYQVIPAGRNFFHIREVTSGRIKGFRTNHIQACQFAQKLEASRHATQDAIVSSPG